MQINRGKLLSELTAVKPGLANAERIEQSTMFVFAEGRVYTYNDEIAVSRSTDLKIQCAIPAQEMYQFLSKVNQETLDMTLQEGELIIEGKRIKTGIKIQEELPLLEMIEEMDIPDNWIDLPNHFLPAIKLCMFSANINDRSRPALTCIHLKGQMIESCDGFRLTRYMLGNEYKKLFPHSILIPAYAIKDLLSVSITSYSLGENWIHFGTDDDTVYSCRLYKGNFPELESLIECNGPEIQFPMEAVEMIDRATVFSKSDFQNDEFITVSLNDNWIIMSGKGDKGWIEEKMRVKYKDDPITFRIRPKVLRDILGMLNKTIICPNKMKFVGEDFIHVVHLSKGE